MGDQHENINIEKYKKKEDVKQWVLFNSISQKGLLFNKTVYFLMLARYEIIIVNLALSHPIHIHVVIVIIISWELSFLSLFLGLEWALLEKSVLVAMF